MGDTEEIISREIRKLIAGESAEEPRHIRLEPLASGDIVFKNERLGLLKKCICGVGTRVPMVLCGTEMIGFLVREMVQFQDVRMTFVPIRKA